MAGQHSRRSLTLALCGGYFLVLLDVTVVNVALPQIGTDLDAGGSGLAWVVDAYSVPLAALLLAAGAIGDRVGHRRVVLVGMAGFGVASVLCAVAPAIGVLIAARAVQGAAAAVMLPGTLALLVEAATREEDRTRLVGIWAAVGGAALPAGPVIGGLLVQAAGWRAVFWLAAPIIAFALVPVLRLRVPGGTTTGARAVDWPGAALLVTVLACLVTAIIQAPTDPWIAPVLGLAAVLLTGAFLLVERRTTRPLVDIPSGSRWALTAPCLVAGVMNLCMLGGLFLLTQIVQDVHRFTPLAAGLAMLPAMLPLPLLGAPAGRLSARIGVWPTAALGLLVSAIGFTGVAIGIADSAVAILLVSLVFWGAGVGILTPAIVAAALRAVPRSPGAASGASNTSRQTGGALGVALFATLAGAAAGAGFVTHTAELFLTSAGVFVLTGTACLIAARRRRAETA